MTTTLKTAMTDAISEVLETMFFLSQEFYDQTIEESGILDQGKIVSSRLFYEGGGMSGCFMLIVPEELLFDMAENFMGQDREEIAQEHLNGTLTEIINMFAGNCFSHYDDQTEFQLKIPEIIDNELIISTNLQDGEEEITIITETTEGFLAVKAIVKK